MRGYISFLGAAVLLLGVLLYVGSASAEKSGWKILQIDSYGNKFSYDAASVKKTADNTVRVSAKSDGAEYLYEIDCKSRKARILKGLGSPGAEWFPIVSGSGELLLYKVLCP